MTFLNSKIHYLKNRSQIFQSCHNMNCLRHPSQTSFSHKKVIKITFSILTSLATPTHSQFSLIILKNTVWVSLKRSGLKELFTDFLQKFLPRMVSEFLPAKTTTLIEFDCVMSFSKMQLSRITNMNDNIIIKGFGLRTGLNCYESYFLIKDYESKAMICHLQ